MNSFRTGFAAVFLAAALSGCSVDIENQPINQPWTGATPTVAAAPLPQHQETIVGLAFSGGGTRAAAFSFGVLKELAKTNEPGGIAPLLRDVDLISGVSGGSITAAYFGYRGEAALEARPEIE